MEYTRLELVTMKRTSNRLLPILVWLLASPLLHAQDTKLPTDADIKALAATYQAERDAAIKSGVAQRFQPALLERADALAKKADAASAAGRFLQAAEALRQARWQLPYQAPGTPTEHLARIIGNPRLRHGAPIYAVAFSPDGQRLASASGDQTVKLWDVANGHEIRTYEGHDDLVKYLAYSPDGQMIASAGRSAVVKLWDPASGKDIRTLKYDEGQEVKALAFSRDGKHLFVSFTPGPAKNITGVLVCFDVKTGAVKRTDTDFRGRVSSLAVSVDGTMVASADESGQVRLWQYPTLIDNPKQPAYWTKQHDTGALYAVTFSPDGKTLVCSGADGVKLYSAVQPGSSFQVSTPRLTLPATSFTKALAFSRDGKSLFTGALDGLIRFWDPESGQMLGSFKGHAGEVHSLSFNPGGNQLASASFDYTVRLWDFDIVLVARELAQHDEPIWSVAFNPEGDRIVTASADRTLRVWDLGGGKAIHTIAGHNAPVTAAAFSPDGKYIASVGADKMLRLWDAATAAALRVGEGHTGTITALDIAADGKRIVTGSADRRIKIWDADTAKVLLSIDDSPSLVAAVAFRPDGKQIAVGNVDQTIALYDTTGKLEQRWNAHGVAVNCVAYSPNGQLLASGGNDTLVRVWSVANPGVDPIVLAGHLGPVSGVAFRKDNQHLASAGADQLVKLWKVEGNGGKEIQTFRGHKDWVTSVAFNKEGFYLASSSVDRGVKLWEITSREAPLLAEHTAAVETIAVSPDGKQIASGSRDRTIKIWDRATGAEIASITAHGAAVSAVVYAPGGAPLVSSGNDRMIRLWDPATFKELPRTAEQDMSYRNMVRGSPYMFVTPDGKRLLTWFPITQANLTTIVECFELASGKRLFSFNETNRKVDSLAFCPNGKLIATGAKDGSVRLWKLEDNRAEMAMGGDWNLFDKIGVADLALSPDGATLVATSNKGAVKIADIARRDVRHTLTAHADVFIRSCLISPDGKRFVTVGYDNLVKCWDMEGKELRRWVMGPSAATRGEPLVSNIAFTPDSRQLVTANSDTTLFVLDLP
jgi:WD40 repeat protein